MQTSSFVARTGATVFLAFACAAAAQTADPVQLTPFGPPGGDVADVVPLPGSPGIVLAALDPQNGSGGAGGVYRSADGGATWSRVPSIPETLNVSRFAPAGNGVVYAASATGTWKSGDAGATWTRLIYGDGGQSTGAVAVAPDSPTTVWAGRSLQGGAVARSLDGGQSWASINPGSTGRINAIAFDPHGEGVVYVAGDRGVWRSPDNGVLWQARSTGLPEHAVTSLVHDGTRLIAGLARTANSTTPAAAGLYVSTNEGLSWTALSDATWPSHDVLGVAVDPANAATLLAATQRDGVFRSTDGGVAWQFPPDAARFGSRSARYAGGTVWAGASGLAVMRSDDGGTTFAPTAWGMRALGTTSVAVNPLDADDIAVSFAVVEAGGVWRTRDGGAQWQWQALPNRMAGEAAYAPDGRLHALLDAAGPYRGDAAGTWSALGLDTGYNWGRAVLAFGHADANLVFASGYTTVDGNGSGRLWRSTDGGAIWNLLSSPGRGQYFRDLEILDDGTGSKVFAVYAGSIDQPPGAIRSTDGGATWRSASGGLPSTLGGTVRMCQRRGAQPALFVAAEGKIKRWNAAAQWWDDVGAYATRNAPLACDPGSGDLYIADGERVLRSGDGGVTFAPYSAALAPSLVAHEIVVQRSGGRSQLFVATATGAYTVPAETLFADGFDD